jgi:hypothetical protein
MNGRTDTACPVHAGPARGAHDADLRYRKRIEPRWRELGPSRDHGLCGTSGNEAGMIPQPLKDVDVSKPLKEQTKPAFVCDPGDPRVKKYGWTKSRFKGYLSIVDKTIWISSIWSL